jgi:hypothetical protein
MSARGAKGGLMIQRRVYVMLRAPLARRTRSLLAMTYGIRLTNTERDLAALHTLAEAAPALVDAPWRALASATEPARRVLVSAALTDDLAGALRARGLDVVALADDLAGDDVARTLFDALPPVRARGDLPADEAIFYAAMADGGAHRTLERLLALGRDDASVAEITDADGARAMLLRVANAPMYLLLRAREEPAEGVVAYARAGDASLWVEWGYALPLAAQRAQRLRGSERVALVDRRGAARYADRALPWRSVYDALTPAFEAPRVDLAAAKGETRFTVRLRLGPAAPGEPELWLLDAEQFLALEALVEAVTPEELARFTVARLAGPSGTRYALQEMVRPGVSRMSVRVSELTGTVGYVRAAGTDNLYLPVGRQLTPRMRRDELRALLELDRARLVVVSDDGDGPRVMLVRTADEVPLARWVDYVATDRRVELERLEEESVFEWPELQIERAAAARERSEARPSRDEAPPPRRQRPPAAKAPVEEAEIPVEIDDEGDDAALREEIRALEGAVARGGCDEAATWSSLGALKARVNEPDDAASCVEAAMFHGAPTVESAAALAALRARVLGPAAAGPEALVALVTRGRLTPVEGAWLGARVIEMALRGETLVDDGFYQQAERVFTDPETPVSRRLAWAVTRALHERTGDRLGVTRARERVLGGLNDRGLSDATDMPRFVRFALALDAGDGAVNERARADQAGALEGLWAIAQRDFVKELTPLGAYLRLVFGIGFGRIGATARGRDLIEPVEAEESVHELPNRLLFKLYRARYAQAVTQGDAAAWKSEVDAILATVKESRVKDRVEWLRTRSEWLRTRAPDDRGAGLKPSVERALASIEEAPDRAGAVLAGLLDDDIYAYEKRAAVEQTLRVALRGGNDDLVAEVLRVASGRLQRVNLLGPRAEVIGACIRAAATLGDGAAVDRLLDEVVSLASAPDALSLRDLLLAVTPGLAALRKLGAGASARRFLDALEPVSLRGQREGIKLRAALADGFLQARDPERAEALIGECVDDVLDGALDHVGRYDAGVAVLAALRHWPNAARAQWCARLLAGLGRFTDSFTASTQRLYETHKVLIAERTVDAVVDDVTFRGDRVRAYLDEEEQVIRRRILADWRDACGR